MAMNICKEIVIVSLQNFWCRLESVHLYGQQIRSYELHTELVVYATLSITTLCIHKWALKWLRNLHLPLRAN
jgi:hypothetical protein